MYGQAAGQAAEDGGGTAMRELPILMSGLLEGMDR